MRKLFIVSHPGLGNVRPWFRHRRSIPQYSWDLFWCHGAAQIPYIEGATRGGAEQHGWFGAVPGIAEWDKAGHSGTEKLQTSQRGTNQYVVGQIAWITIISEWSTGVKERYGYWQSVNRRQRWGGVQLRSQCPEMDQVRCKFSCRCRFRFVVLVGWW